MIPKTERLSTQEQLICLARFDARPHLVLSVYLNLDPARRLRRRYRVVFHDLVKTVQAQLDEEARSALQQEVERVEQYLDTAQLLGKGLVLFSCAPRDFWQVYQLPAPVADDVHVGATPYSRPLLDVVDEYERFAVALVDKEKARLFTIYLGEIEEDERVLNFVPGKTDQGGWSQANYQRHHEAHVYQHVKRLVEQLSELQRTRPFDRLVIAGPEEPASELERMLTKPLRGKVIAKIPGEIFAHKEDILQRTLEVERRLEREAEVRLVTEILEGSDVRAASGVEATLEEIWMRGVDTLAVADTLRLQGSECPTCGNLLADRRESCPACGSRMTPVEDMVERAVERTLDERGRVEVVHEEAARRLTAEGGGMGAMLRYFVPPIGDEQQE